NSSCLGASLREWYNGTERNTSAPRRMTANKIAERGCLPPVDNVKGMPPIAEPFFDRRVRLKHRKHVQTVMSNRRKPAVVGLGYVGLPVMVAFARVGFEVIGYDVNRQRIDQLRRGVDSTREVDSEQLAQLKLRLTNDVADLRVADFFIVTVPTPIDESRALDLS